MRPCTRINFNDAAHTLIVEFRQKLLQSLTGNCKERDATDGTTRDVKTWKNGRSFGRISSNFMVDSDVIVEW